jgi:hypothetical protein
MAFRTTATVGALAAVTMAGATLTSTSAQAQYYWGGPGYTYAGYRHYPRYGHRYAYAPRRYYARRYNPGAAIAGLAFGALAGAAVASSAPYYYGYPYAYGYPSYGYRWGGPVYSGYYDPWW